MDSIHPKFGSSVREYAGVVVLGTSVTGPVSVRVCEEEICGRLNTDGFFLSRPTENMQVAMKGLAGNSRQVAGLGVWVEFWLGVVVVVVVVVLVVDGRLFLSSSLFPCFLKRSSWEEV
jgi:hypothetical protein